MWMHFFSFGCTFVSSAITNNTNMKKQMSSISIILSLGLLLSSCHTFAQSSKLVSPQVDPSIDIDPQTDVLKTKVYATGVQMYNFVLDEKTQKYVLDVSKSIPKAKLFDENGKQIGTHGKGPFWESSVDHSRVEGKPESAKKFSSPNSIPWLLLETKKQDKPGNGIFDNITKIQRVETSGGVPPKDAKIQDFPDKVVSVPYTAVYYFYTKK
jgi:hypothetical protein